MTVRQKTLTAGRGINFAMILRILGQLMMVEAVFMAIPLLVSVYNHESDWKAFAITVALTAATGAALNFLIKPQRKQLYRRDGLLLASVAWVAFSIFGMLPLMLCATPLNVSEAFFEAMSGFTTTGATVIRDVESCSHGILLWRALTQWVGGLGIIIFTLTFIPALNNSGSLILFHAESTGITHDKLGARISRTAKILWGLYSLLTVFLILLLWLGPMSFFDSVCQSFTAISTGGFSTRNDSIAAFNSPYVKMVLTVFMFLGGVSFSLILATARRRGRGFWRNDVLRTYVLFIFLFFVGVVVAIVANGRYTGWQSVTVDPLFHIVSAITSTGFSAGDWEGWGFFVLTLTFLMMYVGACAGSTTGGAKVDRILYLLKNFVLVVKRYIRPRLLRSVSVNGQIVDNEKGSEIFAFIAIYTLLIVFGGLVLVAQGFPIVDGFFSSFSCVSNNGLGAGVTGITGSYDFLPSSGLWIMSLLMLAGRLEIITIISLFVPSFWRK
ncbi:MAG: TrkH family potassium uptake protein [Muribaculaceae bacterium]|nr:TrkH family potassium uptake protein [Muribaculaceae bacterium]